MFVQAGDALDDVAAALADGDGTVREAALGRFQAGHIPETALAVIESATESPVPWTCRQCGTLNDVGLSACSQCSGSAPDPKRKAIELLSGGTSTRGRHGAGA
jgi:hypothetical protein